MRLMHMVEGCVGRALSLDLVCGKVVCLVHVSLLLSDDVEDVGYLGSGV